MVWISATQLSVFVGACCLPFTPTLADTGLCMANEKPVFTCLTAHAVVSLCQGATPTSNHTLTYRFGSAGQAELTYLETPTPAAAAFMAGTLWFSGGAGAYVQFHNGAYKYTVFDAIGKWGDDDNAVPVAGVDVSRNGQDVRVLLCRTGTATSSLGETLFTQMGLKEVDEAGAFKIPESVFPQ